MTPGERVAQVAHELLDPGPMGWDVRRDVYRAFIDANFDDEPGDDVFNSKGTNCAIFVRGVLVQAGIFPPGKRPKVTAITTWIGIRGLIEDKPDTEAIEGAWIPVEELDGGNLLLPGDILFWTGYRWQTTRSLWGMTTNGHVELVGFDGEGWMHPTAGGGGPRHLCKKSDGPKDVRESHQRPLRGVWRPEKMIRP